MHFHALLPVALALASNTLAAGVLTITNKCPETIYIVADNPTYHSATLALVQGNDFQIGIAGTGKYSSSLPTVSRSR